MRLVEPLARHFAPDRLDDAGADQPIAQPKGAALHVEKPNAGQQVGDGDRVEMPPSRQARRRMDRQPVAINPRDARMPSRRVEDAYPLDPHRRAGKRREWSATRPIAVRRAARHVTIISAAMPRWIVRDRSCRMWRQSWQERLNYRCIAEPSATPAIELNIPQMRGKLAQVTMTPGQCQPPSTARPMRRPE